MNLAQRTGAGLILLGVGFVLGGLYVRDQTDALYAPNMKCQIENVIGSFTTSTRELQTQGLVRMWRGSRLFMWPADRIVVCKAVEDRQMQDE